MPQQFNSVQTLTVAFCAGSRGINNTIWLAKQDIPFAPKLDEVTLLAGTHTLPVIGMKSHFTVDEKASATVVHGRFADSSPAVISRVVGSGTCAAHGFLLHPSLNSV